MFRSFILISECFKVYFSAKKIVFLNIQDSWLKKYEKKQQYADIYLLLNYSTCFGRPSFPSSGVHITVIAASGTDHTIWEACFADSMIRMIRNKTTKQQRELGVLLWVLFSQHKYYNTSIFVLFSHECSALILRSVCRYVACRRSGGCHATCRPAVRRMQDAATTKHPMHMCLWSR